MFLLRHILSFATVFAAVGFAFAKPAVFTLPSGVEVEVPKGSPIYRDIAGDDDDDGNSSGSRFSYQHGNKPIELTFRNPGSEARHITLDFPMRVGMFRIFGGNGSGMRFKASVDVPAGETIVWRQRIPCFATAAFLNHSGDQMWRFSDGEAEINLLCSDEGEWSYNTRGYIRFGLGNVAKALFSEGIASSVVSAVRENYERQLLRESGMDEKQIEQELARENRYVRFTMVRKTVSFGSIDDWRDYSVYDAALLTVEEFDALSQDARKALMGYAASGGAVIVLGAVQDATDASHKSRKVAFGEIWFTGEDGIDDWRRFVDVLEASFRRQTLSAQPLLDCDVKAKASVARNIADTPFLTIIAILAAFVVAAGPVSIVILSRKNKRINILWLFPLLAVAFSLAVMAAIIFTHGVLPHIERYTETERDEATGIEATIENTVVVAPFPLSKPICMPADGVVAYFSGDGNRAGARIEQKGDVFEFSDGWTPILWPVRFRTARVKNEK